MIHEPTTAAPVAVCHCELNTPATCIGYVQISGLDADCCECEMPDGSQCCHAQACHGGAVA